MVQQQRGRGWGGRGRSPRRGLAIEPTDRCFASANVVQQEHEQVAPGGCVHDGPNSGFSNAPPASPGTDGTTLTALKATAAIRVAVFGAKIVIITGLAAIFVSVITMRPSYTIVALVLERIISILIIVVSGRVALPTRVGAAAISPFAAALLAPAPAPSLPVLPAVPARRRARL